MTDEIRENIKATVRSKFEFYAYELESNAPRKAFALCSAYGHGVIMGSQDADLSNFVFALLEDYRLKLICKK